MRPGERTENRRQQEQQIDQPGPPGGSDGSPLTRRRQAGEDLLAAGEAIINRALSGNSEAFLTANRQQGGQ